MRGPGSARPATSAAATSALVLARLRRRFTRLDHTRRPTPGPSLAVWYVANVVTHHGAAATGMLGPRRLLGLSAVRLAGGCRSARRLSRLLCSAWASTRSTRGAWRVS